MFFLSGKKEPKKAPPNSLRLPSTLWVVVAVLVGAGLRFHLLSVDVRFHPDEAFFAAFARDAAVRGEWLLPGDLDKTPLSLYGQALIMLTVGIEWDGAVWRLDSYQGEFAARLWSAYASVIVLALTYRFGQVLRLGPFGAAVAGGIVALSPYGVAFGATAFTDTPMLMFVLAALIAALRGQGAWAGLWLFLAYASKQQGVLFLPLVMGLLWTVRPRGWRVYLRFGLAFSAGLVVLALWDMARPGLSVGALAAVNNAPDDLFVWDWGVLWARLTAWTPYLWTLFGGVGTVAVGLLAVIGAFISNVNPSDGRDLSLPYTLRYDVGTASMLSAIGKAKNRPYTWISLFIVGYALLHLLVPLNIYDRYLLPLVPLIAVLAARGLTRFSRRWRTLIVVSLALLMWPGAWTAANVYPTIGGDRGQHDGIINLADYLNSREFGAIVYDRWLGWPLNYYLGGWSDKRRAYYPTSEAMVTDPAVLLPDVAPRYFPVPTWEDPALWLEAITGAGFEVCVGYRSERFRVFVLRELSPSLSSLGGASVAVDLEIADCPGPSASYP